MEPPGLISGVGLPVFTPALRCDEDVVIPQPHIV